MATLNATLTLSSKNATSNEINLTVTKALSVTDPIVGVSKVSASGTGGDNNKSFAELGPGEFLFVPIGQNSGSVAVQLEAVSGTIVAEYAYFTEV